MQKKKTGQDKTNRRAGKPEASSRQHEPGRGWHASAMWLLLTILLLATFAAYLPAWHGGMLWDDDGHITPPNLRSAQGLGRIWFDLGATQQYYPLLHSAFWLQYRLWAGQTTGYHMVNIALHAFAAFLLVLILRQLAIPGAWLAGLLFALHPVQVESVAWIAELKNTLSGVFYLGAALAYIRFDKGGRRSAYALAIVLFLLALTSKTVTATLPAALAVVIWWQRGRLSLRRDAVPLLPFFAFGGAAGLLTAWVERTLIGARGAEFHFTFVERCLIAGRAFWFYLGKLLLPANLTFIYPRWQIDAGSWRQFLFPAAAVGLLTGLWFLRKRTRAPLAAVLYFCITLFPALGFFNVYPFLFSFVADHFQYLASIGIFVLIAAGAAGVARGWNVSPRVTALAAAALAVALAVLTANQSRQYADAETLYRTTLERNPSCWLALNNLGALKLQGGPDDLALGMAKIEEALKFNPEYPDALNNLGCALQRLGRFEEAAALHKKALELAPNFTEARNNLGVDLQGLGRLDEAVSEYREVLKRQPAFAGAHNNLGNLLRERGHPKEAEQHILEALRLSPEYPEAHNNLGTVYQDLGRLEAAAASYREAIRLRPAYVEAINNLGSVLQRLGRFEEAAGLHREALRLRPDFPEAHYNLGNALLGMGRAEDAVTQYREALRLEPDYPEAHNNLGAALEELGRPEEAVAEYRETVRLRPRYAEAHNNLGFILLGMGHIDEAAREFRESLQLQPDFAAAHYNLGNALMGLGNVREAVAHYAEALKYEPESAQAHNNLGVALESLGRLDEAVLHFKEAARIDPRFAEAVANLARARSALAKK